MAAILYLSYDGLTDPLGPSQVLAYLKALSALGHRISLVTFEKPERSAAERAAMAEECRAAGIDWHPQSYTKRPPVLSTLKDLRRMRKVALDLHRRERFDIVHCRSYPPALVGLAVQKKGAKLLFDMRGFWADERVEGGLWNLRHPLYRTIFDWFKRQEKRLLGAADHIVVLTEAAKSILRERWGVPASKPVSVIPCCADLAAFPPITPERRDAARAGLAIPAEARVAAYLGSIGTWYMLGEMLDFFARQRARDPRAVMLFVTRDAPEPILAAAAERGIPADALRVRAASRAEVPLLLTAADYSLFFIRPTFSKQASSPVKLGELLAVELPVVTNAGVGDVDHILEETGGGLLVREFTRQEYDRALDGLDRLAIDPERRRSGLLRWFDLEEGVRRYAAVYRELSGD